MLAYDSVAVLLEDTFSYRVVYIYNETWICRSCDCVTIPPGEVFYKGRFLKSCPKDYFISVYHMCVVRCGTDDILINNSIC